MYPGLHSSLQVVGHMFAYPLVHQLVASTADERDQARELVDDIVGRYCGIVGRWILLVSIVALLVGTMVGGTVDRWTLLGTVDRWTLLDTVSRW